MEPIDDACDPCILQRKVTGPRMHADRKERSSWKSSASKERNHPYWWSKQIQLQLQQDLAISCKLHCDGELRLKIKIEELMGRWVCVCGTRKPTWKLKEKR